MERKKSRSTITTRLPGGSGPRIEYPAINAEGVPRSVTDTGPSNARPVCGGGSGIYKVLSMCSGPCGTSTSSLGILVCALTVRVCRRFRDVAEASKAASLLFSYIPTLIPIYKARRLYFRERGVRR